MSLFNKIAVAYHTKVPAAIRSIADLWVGQDLVDVPAFGLTQSKVSHNVVGYVTVWQNNTQQTYTMVSTDTYRFLNPTPMEVNGIFEEIRKLDLQPMSVELLLNDGKPVFLQDEQALALVQSL